MRIEELKAAVEKQSNLMVTEVFKNNRKLNGVKFKGVVVSPCAYLEDYLEEESIEAAIEKVKAALDKALDDMPDINLSSFDAIKDKLFIRLVGVENNKELLKTLVHEVREDIALVPTIELSDRGDSHMTTFVTKAIASSLNINESTMIHYALSNMRIKPILASMAEMLGFEDDGNPASPTVVTNESKMFGASVIFNQSVIEDVLKKYPEGCYILPSSVHEVLALPMDGFDAPTLQEMVSSINNSQVLPEDRLTDSVYTLSAEGEFRRVA